MSKPVSDKVRRRRELEKAGRAERCPQCGAMPGEPCVKNELGEPAPNMHAVRIRLGAYKPVPK